MARRMVWYGLWFGTVYGFVQFTVWYSLWFGTVYDLVRYSLWFGTVYWLLTPSDEVREVRRLKFTFWVRFGWFMMCLGLNHPKSTLLWFGLGRV